MKEKFIQVVAIVPGMFSGLKSGLIGLTDEGRMFYTTDFCNWQEAKGLPDLSKV